MLDLDLSALASTDWKKRKEAAESLLHRDSKELVEALIGTIRRNHQDLNILNTSLWLLLKLKTPVTPGVVSLMKDPDHEVRMVAAMALGETKDPDAIPHLLSALEDKNSNVRFNAIEALGKLRARESVEPLMEILTRTDFFLSFAAVQALAQIGDPAPIPQLLKLLSIDSLAPAVVQALGRLGEPEVVDIIVNWLGTEAGEAAPAVIALVGLAQRFHLQEQVVGKLHPNVFQKILDSIPCNGSGEPVEGEERYFESLPVFLGWLYHSYPCSEGERLKIVDSLVCLLGYTTTQDFLESHASSSGCQAAYRSLQEIGEKAAPALVEGLNSTNQFRRDSCAQLLTNLTDPRSIPALLETLEAEEEPASVYAARALGKIAQNHPETQEILLEPLVSQLEIDSPSLRLALVDTLSGLSHPVLANLVAPLLKDSNPNLRQTAVRILAKTGADRLEAIVREALDDPSVQVRQAGVEALSSLTPERALPVLAKVIKDKQPELRAAAASTLAGSSTGEKFPLDQTLPLLHEALQDPDPWTRLAACHAVGRFAQPESIPWLKPLIEDSMPPVRAALAEALGKISSSESLALLESLQNDADPAVRKAVQKAYPASPYKAQGTDGP